MELLKEYDINIHHHPGKANVVVDWLSKISMGSIAHVKDYNKEFVKDVHRLVRLGVRLVYSTSGDVSFHPSSESSLVVEVNKGQHFYLALIDLKDSVLVMMNKSFSLVDDGILRYQDRMCVPDIDDLQTKIIVEDMVPNIRYILV